MKKVEMIKTIKEVYEEVNKIRKGFKKGKFIEGTFGYNECKYSIGYQCFIHSMKLKEYYPELVQRALTERGFNLIVLATIEEMIEEENE